jgi:hypothetical protein
MNATARGLYCGKAGPFLLIAVVIILAVTAITADGVVTIGSQYHRPLDKRHKKEVVVSGSRVIRLKNDYE